MYNLIKIMYKNLFTAKRLEPVLFLIITIALIQHASEVYAQDLTKSELLAELDRLAEQTEDKVIKWRRDIHQHPELSNREYRTSKLVAEHLQSLGMEVRTEIAHTGVVAILRGNNLSPLVALRADMDALPVTEEVDVPFASKVRTEYNSQEVGVMHACGHDCHTAMLMGVAEILSTMRNHLPGSVKFIFQPAEEGAPPGEEGGAALMIREGAFENYHTDVIFGQHIITDFEVGTIGYKPGGTMASVDGLDITVRGNQTHGAYPWKGVDPIVTSAQIILGLQSITSRQLDLTTAPAVITIGSIHGGVRSNIIPDEVRMIGTIRSLEPEMRADIHQRIRRTAEWIALSAGATAEVTITIDLPITYNDPDVTERMLPALERITGRDGLILSKVQTGGEDFAFFAEQIPGFYYFLGVRPKGTDPDEAIPLHSPRLFVDEGALLYGVRAMASLAVEYMMEK